MITLKRLNEVRQVASEERAAKLEKKGISRILVFCGREDFPPPLEDVAAQIVEDMLRADQVAPSENDVASVTRGDTSISYRDKANSLKETVAFVKNYESQLIPFKRMKLPKDCPP